MEKAVDPGVATDKYTTHFVLDSELPSLQAWFDAFSAGWEYDFINQSWYEVILIDPPIDGDELEQRVRFTQATTPVVGSFCKECSSMFAHWPSFENRTEKKTRTAIWNASSTHIEAAARNGCKLCSMLHTLLSRAAKLDPMRRIERRLEALERETTSHLVVDIHRQDSEWTLKLMLPAVPEDAQALLEGINVNRILDTHEHNLSLVAQGQASLEILLEDQDWVSTAQAWLKDCSDFHQCTRSASVDRPSRLLDITDARIKLICTSTMEQAPRYATLSYCWGLQPFFMLTRSNLVRLQQDILYEDLPNLFREFVILARSLDIPYIWIDALCIIQHDPEDWLKESSLMAVIYGNAYVNISASSAPSVGGSLYCMQPLHRTGFTKILSTPTKTYKICVSEAEAVGRAVVETHLATRAWTHQERLLAPRTLYYGEQGLFWQCDSMCASNFLPERHPGLPSSSSRTQRDGLFEWHTLVERYSAAQLTHNSDRIVALAGVARRQHELSGDRYFAGMWERDFVEQLWWSGSHARSAWRAPTWSWLSVEGPIRFSSLTKDHHKDLRGVFVQLVRVNTTPSGSDCFGNIKSAELRLACNVLLRMCCDVEVLDPTTRFRTLECRTLSEAVGVHLDASDCGIGKGTELLLMPVIGMKKFIDVQKRHAPTGWLSIQGIALRECAGRAGFHERVGTFWLIGDRATQDFLAAANAELAAVTVVPGAEILPSDALTTARYVLDLI